MLSASSSGNVTRVPAPTIVLMVPASTPAPRTATSSRSVIGPPRNPACRAGVLAGTINTIVGAGTLVTFPLLLALNIPPLVANVSNTCLLYTSDAADEED